MDEQGPIPPRKKPKQQRSQLLFDSVKEACLKILDSEGVDNLTVEHLAEVAGVAVGSLYQYFPCVDSVLSELYLDQRQHHRQAMVKGHDRAMAAATLEEGIRITMESVIAYHRKMLDLNAEFYLRYHEYFHLRQDNLDDMNPVSGVKHPLERLLLKHQQQRSITDISMKAYLLVETIFAALQSSLSKHPEYFSNNEFTESLCGMCMGIIRPE